MAAKTVAPPDFLRKNRKSGAYHIYVAILVRLQLLLSGFLKRSGREVAVEPIAILHHSLLDVQ